MSQYVSLAQIKLALGITDTVDDGRLTEVTKRASELVDAYLSAIRPGYVGFGSVSSNARSAVGSNTRVYDGTGDDTLFIDDAETVVSVAVDTVAVTSNSWRLWPYNETPKRAIIYAQPVVDRVGLVQDTWSRGTANVSVHAFWGMSTVPDDIVAVTLAVANILWRRQQIGKDEQAPSTALSVQRFSQGAGRAAQFVADPEILSALSALDHGWRIEGVWGA